ncbi:hypothetical protein [Mobiluncus curtisii]|uniref:hypothetical protein n=1 Tax=Mobiluncus curtisii TaxID=2051 RepID=UPI001F3FF3BA|nr:hypothetical protein [Mobiluncus curtisii]
MVTILVSIVSTELNILGKAISFGKVKRPQAVPIVTRLHNLFTVISPIYHASIAVV